MPTTLIEIFRDSETHHRLSLFDLAELGRPPQPMPSGWVVLLYLYDLR